ncbi:hypothetical protein ACI2KG_20940 [Pseudomonas sp. NPDC089407]|uniref:hypothetical protein n=1 Tax=Pseudomonas sp. NPDC089407 TaxID=3364464 RepID=UPI00384E9CC6
MSDDKLYYQGAIDFESKGADTMTVHAPKDGSGETVNGWVYAYLDILSITNMPSASEITIRYTTDKDKEISRIKLLTTHHPAFLNKTVDALTYSHLLSIAKEGEFVEYGMGMKVIEVVRNSRAEEHPQPRAPYKFHCAIKVSKAPPTAS